MKKIYFLFVFALMAFTSYAQDSLHRYKDAEIMKLANYVRALETKVAPYMASHPNDTFVNIVANSTQEKQIVAGLISDSLNNYNDAQVIKLARYIKYLEKLDSLNTVAQALADAARKKTADSLALVNATAVSKGMEQYQSQIFFNFDSSVLKEESYKALDEAVKVLKANADLVFIVEGHTDNVGEDAYNLNLSKARAKSVMNYFVSKGLQASRITSEGYGEAKPIASNDTAEGQAKNRRVEIKAKKK
jgi:outer membrane protein OmpA-like peptidoglycan-associated protein